LSQSGGARVLPLGALFYAVVAAIGLAWMWLRGDPLPGALLAGYPTGSWTILWALAAGLGTAVLVVLLSDVVLDRFSWTDLLRRDVLEIFAPLTPAKALLLAVMSGVAEELLFRGALLPAVGLVWSAVLFGLLHGFPDPRFAGWALFAFLMGLVFGGLSQWSQGLLAPMVCHVAINAIQLLRLARQRGSPDAPYRSGASERID